MQISDNPLFDVTRIGLGLAALGRPGYITLGHAGDLGHDYDIEAMRAHTHAVLDAAWDGGVRYFDAARSYGRAEEFLGQWLRARDIDPEDVFVASKWGYTYTAGWQVEAEKHEIKDHSLPVLIRQRAETTVTLGEHLDLYQIHSATLESGVLEDGVLLSALSALKQEGVAIGLTLSGPQQAATLDRALAVAIDGERLFDAVQVTWNLLEPSAESILAEAHAAGMGVVVKEVVANGRLTPRNQAPDFAPQRALLEAQAARLDCTIDALAMAAALAQPWAGIVLSGAATVDQLHSNLTAAAVAWDAEAAAALASLAEPAGDYWARRARMAWN